MQSARNAVFDGQQTLTFYESYDEDLRKAGPSKQGRADQVDRLIDLLDRHASPTTQTFVEFMVEDLNHIRWHPHRVREFLAFKMADVVADPFAWLGRHSAERQGKALDKATPIPPCAPRGPRL